MNRTLKNALVLSLALLLLFSFGACGGSGGDTYKGESASSSASQSGNQSADIDMPESEAGFDGEAETGGIETVRPQDRKLITTVNIQAETRDYDGFMSWLETRVAGAGGYVETSDITNASAAATLPCASPRTSSTAFCRRWGRAAIFYSAR